MKKREKRHDAFHYLKIAIAILLVVLVLILAVWGFLIGRALFTDAGQMPQGQGVEYQLNVREGESTFQVGRDLESNEVIGSALVFLVQSKLFKCTIKPGTYTVNSAQSSKAILKQLNQK